MTSTQKGKRIQEKPKVKEGLIISLNDPSRPLVGTSRGAGQPRYLVLASHPSPPQHGCPTGPAPPCQHTEASRSSLKWARWTQLAAGASYSTGGSGCSLSNTKSFLGAARCVCACEKSGSAGSLPEGGTWPGLTAQGYRCPVRTQSTAWAAVSEGEKGLPTTNRIFHG